LLLFVAGAASLSDEIVARKITIVNDKGQPLITLGSWGQGSGGLILVNSMPGSESAVQSIDRGLALRKELGEKWGAAIVGLPASAAIYMMSKNAVAGTVGQMNIEPTSIGFGTSGGRGVGLSARDPYESEYQGHKQTVEGEVSFSLSDYSNIGSDPPSLGPSHSIGISIFKEQSQIEVEDITTKGTTSRAALEVDGGSDGVARLRLSDDSDKSKVVLGVNRGSPAVFLTNPKRSRLDLIVNGNQPRLDLHGPQSGGKWTPETSLFLDPGHASALLFFHDNSMRTGIGVGKDGKPYFLR